MNEPGMEDDARIAALERQVSALQRALEHLIDAPGVLPRHGSTVINLRRLLNDSKTAPIPEVRSDDIEP